MAPPSGGEGDAVYSVPSTHDVTAAALTVLRRHHSVTALGRLTALVLQRLRETHPNAALRPERLRRLLVADPRFEVEIHYREEPSRRALSRCPVCRSPLTSSKNLTIFGGTVTVGHTCTRCQYWTGRQRRVPMLYRIRTAPAAP